MLTVTATIGIPRSGKSTYAQNQLKINKNLRRVNRDDIRSLIAHESLHNTNPFENEVSNIQHYLIIKHLKNALDVIIDNTNVKPERIQDITNSIQEFSNETNIPVLLQTKLFNTDIDTCIQRNEICKKNNERYVPKDVILKMHATLTTNLNNKSISEYKTIITPTIPIQQNINLPKAIICDIDGTLANIDHRNPYDTAKCLDDTPITPIVDLVKLFNTNGYKIIFLSGREEQFRDETTTWLNCNQLYGDLFMRQTGDNRKDSIIKKEIISNQLIPNYYLSYSLDDRNQVVRTIRDLGITCLQVNYGDF